MLTNEHLILVCHFSFSSAAGRKYSKEDAKITNLMYQQTFVCYMHCTCRNVIHNASIRTLRAHSSIVHTIYWILTHAEKIDSQDQNKLNWICLNEECHNVCIVLILIIICVAAWFVCISAYNYEIRDISFVGCYANQSNSSLGQSFSYFLRMKLIW